jgi:hypothetical protein
VEDRVLIGMVERVGTGSLSTPFTEQMSRSAKPTTKEPDPSELLSAKRATAPSEGDLAVVERLVNDGKLIAIPPGGNAKPRRVAVAALHDGGDILLYLSRAKTSLTKK